MDLPGLSNVVATVATATAGLTTALWIQSKTDIRTLGQSTKTIEDTQKTMECELRLANDKLRMERKRNEDLVEQNRVLLREKQEVYKKLKLSEMEKSVLETDKEIASKDLALAVHQKTLLEEEIQNPSRGAISQQEMKLREMLDKSERKKEDLESQNSKLHNEISDIKTQLTMVRQDNEKKTEEIHHLMKENIALQLQYEYLLKSHRKLGGTDKKIKTEQEVEDEEKKILQSKLAMAKQENERLKMECSTSSFAIKVKDIIEILKEKKNLEERLRVLEKETQEIREEMQSPSPSILNSRKAQLIFDRIKNHGDNKGFVRRHRSYSGQSKHTNAHADDCKDGKCKKDPHKCQSGNDNRIGKGWKGSNDRIQAQMSANSISCCCQCSDLKDKLSLIRQMESQISLQTAVSEKTLKLSQAGSCHIERSATGDTVFTQEQDINLEEKSSSSTMPNGLQENMR